MQIKPRHWVLALALALALHLAFFLLSGLQQDNQTSLAGGGTQISLDLAGDGQTAAENIQEAAVQSTNNAVTPENTSEASEAVPEDVQVEENNSEVMVEASDVTESQSETPPPAEVQTSAPSEETLEQAQAQEEAITATPEERAEVSEPREIAEVAEVAEAAAEAADVSDTVAATEQETRTASEPETATAQAVSSEQEQEAQEDRPEEPVARSRPEQPPPRKPQDQQMARKPTREERNDPPTTEPESLTEEIQDNEGAQEEEQAALGDSGAGASETSSAGQTENPGTGDAETADALQRYLGELGLWLERHKDYPRAARQRRQEGTAILRFVINQEGSVLEYSIEKSAGHSLLDREVEAMIQRAQPLPEPPDEIDRERMEFRVPLAFKLR